MKPQLSGSIIALALASAWPSAAHAQDAAEVARELADMRAQMAGMAARIDELEDALSAARNDAAAATQAAGNAVAIASEAKDKKPVEVAWKGAPQFKGEGGWSFKPRGRLQFDAGTISAPDSTGRPDGFGNEVRRARLGVEGDVPGGFGYKFEVDFTRDLVEVSDAFMSYQNGGLKISAGQHNPFQGLEELTSSRFTSMMERAAFTDAFEFERRLGLSAQYKTGEVLIQGGAFSDNLADLSNKSWSIDGRAVYMPRLGETQLHFGGSLHYSKLNDAANTVRYRQRPFVHFTNERFIDTGSFSADSETGYGLEAAAIAGRFHAAAETYWQKVGRPVGFADPTFFGGYAELGYFLTRGDHRGYSDGIFERVKPSRPVGKGGIGAVQVNLRYDYLDLSDAGIIGGRQRGYAVSVIWTTTDYTRLMLNYGRMQYDDAVHSAGVLDGDYGVDAFGMRAQIDF